MEVITGRKTGLYRYVDEHGIWSYKKPVKGFNDWLHGFEIDNTDDEGDTELDFDAGVYEYVDGNRWFEIASENAVFSIQYDLLVEYLERAREELEK